MLLRLADWCFRKRRLVVLAWIAVLIGTSAAATAWGGEFRQNYLQPGSESQAASKTLTEQFPQRAGDTIQIVIHADVGITSPDVQARAQKLFADVRSSAHVVGLTSPFSDEGAGQISADGTTGYADVALDKKDNQFTVGEAQALVDPVLRAGDATMRVEVGGAVAALSQTAAAGSEVLGLAAAAVILLVVFGSAVAMGLPLLTAVFGLGVAMALGGLLRRVVDIPEWAAATAAIVGIGVGIDYALFIVTRFRSSLTEGQEPRRATLTAMATSGRAVLFAGLTVVIAMLGLLFVGQPAINGFAVTVVLTLLVVLAATLTLLPAVLGFAGRNIERLHVPFVARHVRDDQTSRWYRWSRFVQRRPARAAVCGLAVLLALSAPVLGLRLGFPDAGNDPAETTTRQAYDLLAQDFGPGFSAPILLTVQGSAGPALRTSTQALGEQMRAVPGVALVRPVVINDAGDTAVVSVVPTTSQQDAATSALVDTLRDTSIPAATAGTGLTVHVGGLVAVSLDATRGVSSRLPVFFGGVLLLSFLLLLAVFRSVVVPAKAVVMNLLSSAAAFGVLALAVNGGLVGDLVGIPEAIPVPIQLPLGIFAILFGLSMDYEVFLLSRIREEYDRTGDNALAVADGLAKSARVITAGAAVMVTVFLAFVLGGDVFGKMFGVGLASAIFIDATLVRMVLVPATMELLGKRNWWLPGWLDRLLPDIHVEGHDVSAEDVGAHDAPRDATRRQPVTAVAGKP